MRYKPKFDMQGSGYVGNSPELRKEYKKWNKILADTGFVDVEFVNSRGFFSPVFRQGSVLSNFNMRYNEFTDLYYQKARMFLNDFDFEAEFGSDSWVYRRLWYLHSEGISYRAMSLWFKGAKTPKLKNVKRCPINRRRDVSYFWTFSHTQRVMDCFWVSLGSEGYKDTRGLIQRKPTIRKDLK